MKHKNLDVLRKAGALFVVLCMLVTILPATIIAGPEAVEFESTFAMMDYVGYKVGFTLFIQFLIYS